jgi:hypothetical protein
MPDDAAAGEFPPPDADQGNLAEVPDPAFGETDDDDEETPDPGEPE